MNIESPIPRAAADHGSEDRPYDVVVIGAGFSGIAMAHMLSKQRGTHFVVLEKGSRAGGTWRDNTYPGCACDIPSHLYSLSFAPNADWTRMFPSQPEILEYFETVIDRFDLRQYVRLDTRVESADWQGAAGLWRINIAGQPPLFAKTLVSAVGVLHHAAYPDIAGRERFAGKTIHTAWWDHDYDVGGKRVGIIGTGASAVQVVPAIADKVAHLSVFQRTPPWIAPRFDRAIPDEMRHRLRTSPLFNKWFRAKLFWAHEKRATGFTKQNPKALARSEALCRGLIDRQVKDPALKAKLVPNYKVGCKRLTVSSDYYPALQKPNVSLVTDSIVDIDATGVNTADGTHHDFDLLIYATGYDAQRPMAHMPIRGAEGLTLEEQWERDGKNALLGTTTVGFPNFFMITGPHTGGGHNSQVFMIEAQVHYIGQALRRMRRKRAGRMEVTRSAQNAFAQDMDRRMDQSVWKGGGCMSWFLDPRTGRNTLLWPGYSTEFWVKTRRLRDRDYDFAD
jgi:cation diffusion facilitator CzcD-associated flavoprotein CzcO